MLRVLLLARVLITRAQSSDLDLIANRVVLSLFPAPNALPQFEAAVGRNLSFVTVNYTFSDIDYDFCENANWPAMLHPERTRSFIAAYATQSSSYYKNATLLATVHGLLGWWLAWNAKHKSTNWWMNEVGVPGYLAGAGLILQSQDALTPSEAEGIVASTRGADTYKGCEPTNCVWLAGNVFLGALLERNATVVARTVTDMLKTIDTVRLQARPLALASRPRANERAMGARACYPLRAISSPLLPLYATSDANYLLQTNPFSPGDPSGIKTDGSFMMHGSLLYNGG
jgi:hypothetical protein